MASYIEPIRFALMVFPFLALAISAIFFIYQYRKYGTFILSRAIILYSFIFYLLCAYFLVILPLPSKEVVAQMKGPTMELKLFASWQDFFDQTVLDITNPHTYIPAMKQKVFLEPIFNILLTIPLGIYLRYYFRFSFFKTLLASVGLSLFFELTQLSGLYFIYPRAYRLFDVNDLLHNTLGGILGYAIAPIVTFMLPTRKQLDERSYEKGQTVSLTRRFAAWVIDWTFLSIVRIGVTLLLGLTFHWEKFTSQNWWTFLEIVLYFMVLPYLTNGRTLGKKVVRIQLVEDGHEKISLPALIIRYSYLYFIFYGLSWLTQFMDQIVAHTSGFLQASASFVGLGFLLALLIFIFNIGLSIVLRKRVLFYEKASHTHTISTVKKDAE